MGKQEILHILSACLEPYPTSKAHRPYYIFICGLFGYAVFFHNITQRAQFSEKKFLKVKYVIFPSTLKSFCYRKNPARSFYKCTNAFKQSTHYPCQILMKLNFLNRFTKSAQTSNLIQIHPVGGDFFYSGGQANRQDEANSRFSQFCKCT